MMIEKQKIVRTFIDKACGKNLESNAFKALTAFGCVGDTLITDSVFWIARNTRDQLSAISSLTEKEAEFISLKENIDTTTHHGRFMITVFGTLAELECESIIDRQCEGIEIVKAEGKYKGCKPVTVVKPNTF